MEPLLVDLIDVHAEGTRTAARIGADQWELPTPCEAWTVADVVRHQVVGHRVFAALLRGESVDMAAWNAEIAGRETPELTTMFARSGRELERAFADPGALQRRLTLPMGEVPGEVAVHLRLAETMVHAWDVGRATTHAPRFSETLVEREIEVSRRLLEHVPEGSPAFGPPVSVPDDAPALDRLAGLLGRRP